MKVKLYDNNRVAAVVDCNDIDHIDNPCQGDDLVKVHKRNYETICCDDVVFMLEGEGENVIYTNDTPGMQEKEIDNFNLIADKFFKQPLAENEFYFLQIFVRGKDGNAVSGNNKKRLVRFYTIKTAQQLLDLKREIITICKTNNARAYIHPTKRDYKAVANVAIETALHSYVSQNYAGLKAAYSTACGKSFIPSDKKFIVDIDNVSEGDDIIEKVRSDIFSIRGHGGVKSEKVIMDVPTKSGVHLITWPFDLSQFKEKHPDIDVHKNNPTLLYYS